MNHEHWASLVILKTLLCMFLIFCLAVSRASNICFALLEVLILVSLKDLETKLGGHNKHFTNILWFNELTNTTGVTDVTFSFITGKDTFAKI